MNEQSIMLFKEVLARVRVSSATFYRTLMGKQNFPKPFKIGLQKNAWLRADVEKWIMAQAAGVPA